MSEKVNKILYLALSLLLAIIFWLYVDNVKGNTIPKEFNAVPVEFIGAEDTLPSRGLMLVDGEDATIDLTVTGPRAIVSSMRRGDVRVQVNLTSVTTVGTHPMTYTYATSDNININDISIQGSRSTITVQVAPLYSKSVPVQASVEGDVAEGYIHMSEQLAVEPAAITLSGKEEDVDQVESVRVRVDLTDVSSTIQKEFSYELLDSQGNLVENDGIRVSHKRVAVTAPVYIIKELPLVVSFKQAAGSMEADTRWDLEYDTIQVAGEPASLESLNEITLGEVDLAAILSDRDDIQLNITMPAGCYNLSGYTSTRLTIRFRNLETRAFSVSNITPIGLSDGQSFSRITNSVDVLLRGPAAQLEEVTEEDIRVVVDLTNFVSSGTYNVDAIVLVDGHDKVGAVGSPPTVACKITSK